MSQWQRIKKKWSNCTECALHECRNKTVLFKGKIPCDVLFIGDAPSKVDNVRGKPFSGPAGLLLDDLIVESGLHNFRLGFTQTVACIPLGEDGQKKSKPPKEALDKCSPRVIRLIEVTKPSVIVAVGKSASNHLEKILDVDKHNIHEIISPGYILTSDSKQQQGVALAKIQVNLKDVLEELCQE